MSIGLIRLLPLRFIVAQQDPERPLTVGDWIVVPRNCLFSKNWPAKENAV